VSDMNHGSKLVAEFVTRGHCASCPVFNVHSHAGPFPGIYMATADPDEMVQSARRAGVRMTLVASHKGMYDVDGGNEYTAQVVKKYPDETRGYWAVNSNYPEQIEQDVAQLDDRPEFIGFKFWPSYYQYAIDGPNNRLALEYANRRRMPCLVHTWGNNSHCGPDNVRVVAERYPDIPLFAAHSFSGQWDEAIRIATDFPNLFLDLTGVTQHNGLVEMFVSGAGSENIVFGTDSPWFGPYYPLGCVLLARITDEDRHNILHRNAERMLGLSEEATTRRSRA